MTARRNFALGAAGLMMVLGAIATFAATSRNPLTLNDYPMATCTVPATPQGRVFHVDPQLGSPEGDGSRARPWKDLQALVDKGQLGEYKRGVSLAERLVAAILHRPVTFRLEPRAGARVKAGDTVLLSSGQYGAVDLSGLENSNFVMIAAAPGATPQFISLNLAGASHFILRGLRIAAPTAQAAGSRLVIARAYPLGRADNIVLDGIEVAGTMAVAKSDPDSFAAEAPDGLVLSGDCLTLRDSEFHDLRNAISIYRVRNAVIERNMIRDFSVDGIAFTGRDILIHDNMIFNQWPTPDMSHPDCMQGQHLMSELFGPVTISHNVCVRQISQDSPRPAIWLVQDRFGWMGINIFNGLWRNVTIRCNLVMPQAQHGMGLYGLSDSIIEHNVVLGTKDEYPTWSAVMPSKGMKQPKDVLVRSNRATGFLNAVHGGAIDPQAMIDYVKARRWDRGLMDALRKPITGVTLENNHWLVPTNLQEPLVADSRFDWEVIAPITPPIDIADALARYPLPDACAAAR